MDVKTRLLSISLTFYFQELTIDGYGGVFTLHWALEGNNSGVIAFCTLPTIFRTSHVGTADMAASTVSEGSFPQVLTPSHAVLP